MSTYDVEAERTDEKAKSQYLSKKDIIRLVIGLVVLGVLLYPIYVLLLGNAQYHLCSTNFNQMFKGISLYTEENNERLPPVYVTTDTDAPLIEKGSAYTWVSLVDGYVKDPSAFTCPTASKEEVVRVKSSLGGSIDLTYGMYAPLGGEPKDQIDNPDQVVLLGETDNMSADRTYDPFPFKDSAGNVVPFDAFVLGFDDSNLLPTTKSRFITRLAFPDSDQGVFAKKGHARHREGIHVLSVSGRLRTIHPDMAQFRDSADNVNPLWTVPKTRKFRN